MVNEYIMFKLFMINRPLDTFVVTFIINVCEHVLTFRSWCIYYYVLEYVFYICPVCHVNVLHYTPKYIKTLETPKSNVCRYGPVVNIITTRENMYFFW